MSIVKRTVLYEKKDGLPFRFSDWALVVTTDIGSCVEPFCHAHKGFQQSSTTFEYDPTDEMTRIDLMQNIDITGETGLLSGFDGHESTDPAYGAIHGGKMMPRNGK